MCRLLGLRCCLTVLTCVSCGCALFANQPGPPPPPATQPIMPEAEVVDGYERASSWDSLYAGQKKVKFCDVLYDAQIEDKIGKERCQANLAMIRQSPEKLSASRYYFCMSSGRRLLSVPIADKEKLETFPKGQNICFWLNENTGGGFCTFGKQRSQYQGSCPVQYFDDKLWTTHSEKVHCRWEPS